MKASLKTISLFASAALLTFTSLSAVETVPVGYVSFSVNDESDLLVGVPLTQSPSFSGTAASVTGSTVTVSSSVPDISSVSSFLIVTDTESTLYGQWYQISSATSTSVTVVGDLESAGLAVSETFSIIPFWTLDTLFPSGGGVPSSPNPFNPSATIIVNDIQAVGINPGIDASYVYYDGSQGGDAGWYNADDFNLGVVGDTPLSPETFITIRNRSGGAATIVFSGTVPTVEVATNIVSSSTVRQDNLVANPFPAAFTLSNSNLVSSGAFSSSADPFSPTDTLFVYTNTTGVRPGPTKSFIYYDGSQGGDAGWYDANDFGLGLQGSYSIPAGAALVIRKAVGTDVSVAWSPALPYTL